MFGDSTDDCSDRGALKLQQETAAFPNWETEF